MEDPTVKFETEKEIIQVIQMTEEVIKEEPTSAEVLQINMASASPTNSNMDAQNSTSKRKTCYTSDDDEAFPGFDKSDMKDDGYSKKFKTDSSSESEQTTPSKRIVLRSDPLYLVPFKYGWKRELVLRAEPVMSKEKGEVYYITPNGKKLRTRHEIQNHLHDDLTINHFTLVKEALGAPPEYELIRNAKFYNFARRTAPEVTTPEPLQVLGKRTPKPKLPKGASPPPPSIPPRAVPPKPSSSRSQSSTPKQSPKVFKENHESVSGGGSTSKAPQNKGKSKGGCSIQCIAAMGKIPQIQCKQCLHIFHPECIQITPIGHGLFLCENCTSEHSPPAMPTASSSRSSQEPHARRQQNPTQLLHQQPQPSAKILANVNSNTPKSHNFNKNPQTIVSCKNNKFIVFEASSPADDEMQLNSLRKKLYEDLNKSASSKPVNNKSLVETPVARPAPANKTNTSKSPVATNASAANKTQSPFNFSVNFCSNVALGYNVLLQTFQYLKIQELQRASCVCRMWNHLANHRSLWRTVRMKNSHVNDWEGFVKALKRNGTKHLDLRKMLMGNQEDSWREFSDRIGTCVELEAIDLCRCQSQIVETMIKSNPSLKVINAVSLKDEKINLIGLMDLQSLEELRLRTNHANGMKILLERKMDEEKIEQFTFSDLNIFENMKHLSLTSVQNLNLLLDNKTRLKNLSRLESLELGYLEQCDDVIVAANLMHLQQLKRLRLEKGSAKFNINAVVQKVVSALPSMRQLELINCDIKNGFDDALKSCTNLKKLLLIPTYVSQSAATNYMVLRGVMNLGNYLDMFVWVVTSELLRVTELYVDQCDTKGEKSTKRSPDKSICSPMKISDCIPILKPVPGLDSDSSKEPAPSADNIQKIEIVNLKTVESILSKSLANSKFKLLKISHVNTWKQTMIDLS